MSSTESFDGVKLKLSVRDVAARGRLPIVVGGAGLYLRALLLGLFEGPARDAILGSTFKPAKIKGQPVRQLVQQRVSFTIGS